MDALAKIKYRLLILLIAIFPIGVLSRIDLGSAVAVTLNDLVVAAVAIFSLAEIIKNRKIQAKLLKPITVFTIAILISLLLNYFALTKDQLLVSGSYVVRWATYAFLYFAVVNLSTLQKQNLLKYLGISGIVTVSFGLAQLVLYPNLRNLFYAGWDEHLYRIFTGFLDPNFSGIIFVLLFILLISGPFKKYLPMGKMGLILGITFISIVLTFSRTAIMAFIVSISAYGILKKDKRVAYALVLGVLLMAIFYLIVPKKESTNFFRTASTLARVDHYKQGFVIFSNNPVFGVGFNSYRYALERYGFVDKMKYGPSHGASGNDNSFLFVLVTSGIIGFAGLLYLLFKAMQVRSKYIELRRLTLLCVIVGSFFVNALFFVFIMEWIWIVLASTENT